MIIILPLVLVGMVFAAAEHGQYDYEADVQSFIRKIRIEKSFVLENSTSQDSAVTIEYQGPRGLERESRFVPAAARQVVPIKEGAVLKGVHLENSGAFLRPQVDAQGELYVYISEKKGLLYPFEPFVFRSGIYSIKQLRDATVTEQIRTFRANFNIIVEYMQFVCNQHKTSMQHFDAQRNELYAKNNITQLINQNPALFDVPQGKIPLITHKIWVTAQASPKEPLAAYVEWLENSILHNPVSEGWTHYFWIQNKALMPALVERLEKNPAIVIRELDQLDDKNFLTGSAYKRAIANREFGKAADILRLELLRIYGGFYFDTDYELFQSLIPWSKAYTMLVGLEYSSVYVGNAFIGACAYHPVVTKALEIINRNVGQAPPYYIRQIKDDKHKTVVETGPVMFSVAFALAAGQPGFTDIVLPPQYLYPAAVNQWPTIWAIQSHVRMPPQAIGAHYWQVSWMNPKLGGKG